MVQAFLPLLTAVSDPVVRAHYLQRLSRLSMVTEEEITTMLRSGAKNVRTAPQKAPLARRDHKEEFVLALLLRYNELRTDALDIPETLFWESENRQVIAAIKRNVKEDVKTGVTPEIEPHFERLNLLKLPPFDLKQAREALLDAVSNLQHRQIAAEKRATSALLATREEELGSPTVAEAVAKPASELESEEARELVELQLRDMETGLRLHGKGKEPGRQATVAGD
jgi:hypothetical protein